MRIGIAVLLLVLPAAADEGMWLFNQFPTAQVKTRYGFDASPEFLDHLRLSSVRIGGGSGSFVSPHGLIFTNHHVAQPCITKVSVAGRDYMKLGFHAASQSGEVPCPDMEANVLLQIEDVTAAVKGAAKPETPAAEEVALRRAAIARIEKACTEKTGNRCDVVKLFSGERYDLYQYKRYTDLRLVFAPEFAIAFFGGDPDNFTYPRYDLDITFLRAYEDGQPAATPHYLKWSAEGAKDGELVFVAGNPGSTSRLLTNAQLDYMRESSYPPSLARLTARIDLLTAYGAQSGENQRVAQRQLFSFSNSYKGSAGKFAGLGDRRLLLRKRAAEQQLRAAVERDPQLGPQALKVWDDVAAAYRKWAPSENRYQLLETGAAAGVTLFRIARDLVRLTAEGAKPDDRRMAVYRDSGRRSLELSLYSPAPITDSLEILLLTQYFADLQQALGAKDPVVKRVLAGRTPRAAAAAYVGTTKLKDVAVRRQLAGDQAAVERSEDGMIQLARLLDEPARQLRKLHEDTVEAVEVSAAAKIASYRFRMFGAGDYPDATFTPRLTFGVVKGYQDRTGHAIPWAATFGGLYGKATGADPYVLPQRWAEARKSLNEAAPMNFVSTVDITGGNSGSPTVNRSGEVVGIVFDSNIEGLPNIYLYTDEQARSVHVASQAIVEALAKVYRTPALLQELGAPASH